MVTNTRPGPTHYDQLALLQRTCRRCPSVEFLPTASTRKRIQSHAHGVPGSADNGIVGWHGLNAPRSPVDHWSSQTRCQTWMCPVMDQKSGYDARVKRHFDQGSGRLYGPPCVCRGDRSAPFADGCRQEHGDGSRRSDPGISAKRRHSDQFIDQPAAAEATDAHLQTLPSISVVSPDQQD